MSATIETLTLDQMRAHLVLHGWAAWRESGADRHDLSHSEKGTVWCPAYNDDGDYSEQFAAWEDEPEFGLSMDEGDRVIELADVPAPRLLVMWVLINEAGLL